MNVIEKGFVDVGDITSNDVLCTLYIICPIIFFGHLLDFYGGVGNIVEFTLD